MSDFFLVAIQSSLFLGIIHGINPCGHSWLILAPFIYGEKNGKRVFSLTSAFIIGTSLACLIIGASLGSISLAIPASVAHIVDLVTIGILLILGLILIVKPHLLHSHSHDDHEHEHHEYHEHHDQHGHHEHDDHSSCHHEHDHSEHNCSCSSHKMKNVASITAWGLFSIGFVNMIVPCPTVAIMYSHALNSRDILQSTLVFMSYAVGTAISLSVIIYTIYKVSKFMDTLQKPWIEPLVMRTAGLLTILFAIYSYFLL